MCEKDCENYEFLQDHEDYNYERRDLIRQAAKLRQLEDLFEAILGFRIAYVWGSYMPTKIEHEEKMKAAIKAVKELDK